MKIREGKYYLTRNGRVIGPMREIVSRFAEKWKFWAIGFNDGAPCWTDEGRWSDVDNMHEMDLIREVYVSDTPPDAPAPEAKTLRDDFAMAVVSGVYIHWRTSLDKTDSGVDFFDIAEMAYGIADAMMEVRNK
jgi:hypothetical protein